MADFDLPALRELKSKIANLQKELKLHKKILAEAENTIAHCSDEPPDFVNEMIKELIRTMIEEPDDTSDTSVSGSDKSRSSVNESSGESSGDSSDSSSDPANDSTGSSESWKTVSDCDKMDQSGDEVKMEENGDEVKLEEAGAEVKIEEAGLEAKMAETRPEDNLEQNVSEEKMESYEDRKKGYGSVGNQTDLSDDQMDVTTDWIDVANYWDEFQAVASLMGVHSPEDALKRAAAEFDQCKVVQQQASDVKQAEEQRGTQEPEVVLNDTEMPAILAESCAEEGT